MATIEHRGPNAWRVGVRTSVDQGHQWIRRSLSFPAAMPESEQRRQAELAAAQLMLDVEAGRAVPSNRHTVRSFYDLWIDQHVQPELSPVTLKNYRYLMESRILPALGDFKLQKLTTFQIVGFMTSLKSEIAKSTAIPADLRVRKSDQDRAPMSPRPLSGRTLRHYYDCLNYMLNKAVQWKFLSKNPMDDVDRPKIKKSKVNYLDDVQAIRLLRCLSHEESLPFRCAVLLALLCGLRLGEVGALRLEDVNWSDCSINIDRALKYTPDTGNYVSDPKTESGDRIIDLPPGMMALLDETRKYHADAEAALGDRWYGCGRIACNWDGRPYHHDTPSKQFRKFADANGFYGVRFHDLRHTHATLLFADNIDAVAIASRMGHADASTTLRIYAHAIRRRDRESATAMQNLLDQAYAVHPVADQQPPADPDQP